MWLFAVATARYKIRSKHRTENVLQTGEYRTPYHFIIGSFILCFERL